MSSYTKKEITTDILIIGGGIAAVFAATRGIENGAKVTLVDKGSVGRSGQTPFASGMTVFDESLGHDRDNWHRILAENSYNLNNPAYLDNFMDYSKGIYEELEAWGATDIGFGKVFRTKIIDLGVEVIERTMITTLLESDGKIGGAVGFKLDTEEAVVIKAKSVIICTGAGGFKPSGFQVCSLSFDGDAMAYRIGAKISGKEFMDTHATLSETPAYCWGQWEGMWNMGLPKETSGPTDGGGQALDLSSYHSAHAGSITLSSSSSLESEGTMGERPSEKPDSEMLEGEMLEGEMTPGEMPEGEMPTEGEMPSDGGSGGSGGGPGQSRSQLGGASAGLSVHKAEGLFPSNNKCATNISGLYAAGDCLSSMLVGPIYNGVVGFSVMGSATQGALAGEVAADYIKDNSLVNISDSDVETAITDMFEPLTNTQGYDPAWVEHLMQGALIPYYVLYIKKEDRLNAALTNITFYQEHFATKFKADDLHDLRKAHEVKNMLLNAEMKIRSSLFRTESRGNHYREDYPDSNDNDWLAWVVLQKGTDGSMELEKFLIEDFEALA